MLRVHGTTLIDPAKLHFFFYYLKKKRKKEKERNWRYTIQTSKSQWINSSINKIAVSPRTLGWIKSETEKRKKKKSENVCSSFFWGNRVCSLIYTTQIKTSSLQLHGPGRFVPGFCLSSSSDHRRTLQRNFSFNYLRYDHQLNSTDISARVYLSCLNELIRWLLRWSNVSISSTNILE